MNTKLRDLFAGDVVKILIGEYRGGNGKVIRTDGKRILVEVDPLGKTRWFNRTDLQ